VSEEEVFKLLLRRLGLSPYEASAYSALVRYGPLTATELSKITHIPQSRVYDVVSKLMKKGFVAVSGGSPSVYRAIRPSVALRAYSEEVAKNLSSMAAKAAEIGETLRGLQPLLEDARIWSTTSLSTTVYEMASLLSSARVEVLAALSLDAFQRLQRDLQAASERGVSVCLVTYDELPPQRYLDEQYERRTRGPQILVSDRQEVLIATRWDPAREQAYAFTTSNQELMRVFVEYYLMIARGMAKLVYTRFGREITERSFLYLQRAVSLVKELWRSRMRAEVLVQGVDTKTYEPVEVSGIARKVYIDMRRGVTTLYIRSGKELVSVGGWGAYLEDIQANFIHVRGVPRGG